MTAEIYKEIFIEKIDADNVRTGYLSLKSSETLKIDSIKGFIFLETRGRMSGQKDTILTLNIPNQSILIKNESYKIPFSFELKKSQPDSYQGINVSLAYNCEIQISVNESDLDKIERSLFTKLKSFVTSNNSIKTSTSFEVKRANSKYQIVETKTNFELKLNLTIAILTALIYGGTFAFLIPNFSNFYIFIGIASVAISIYLATKLVERLIGIINLETIRDEDAFRCRILRPHKMNLSHQKLYYEIIERVIDKRGTSSQTYNKTIHLSANKKLADNKENSTFTFQYPDRKGLHSYEYTDSSILWQMNLEGIYYGITLKYKCIFTVLRT